MQAIQLFFPMSLNGSILQKQADGCRKKDGTIQHL